jgi:hypothetical protein
LFGGADRHEDAGRSGEIGVDLGPGRVIEPHADYRRRLARISSSK